jgi:DNA-binding helix-hairpin-helix protein with protein kinase domain
MTLQLFDGSGNAVTLGPRLAQGGEGVVFRLPGNADRVAKIYHDDHRPDQRKAEKLLAMVLARSDRLAKLTAWPIGLLHEGPRGPVRGFVMPMLNGFKEAHLLYTPKSRLAEFPDAGWDFLVHAAKNMAIAFHAVHSEGHVIGDVNHGNIFVSNQAIVRLIDCDSFQISRSPETYLCEVGVPTHTPPELQGKSFKSIRRTANHDVFGLAVAIFQLLFLGRHPFCGLHLGKGEPPSLEIAISEFKFAYGQNAECRQIRPPPGGLSLRQVTLAVASLFERAFSPAAAGPQGRPTAEEWAKALEAQLAVLQTCVVNAGHVYLRTNDKCPWCAFEVAAGRAMFNFSYQQTGQSLFNLKTLAAEIAAVAAPARLPVPLQVKTVVEADPEYAEAGNGNWRQIIAALGSGAIVAGLGVLPSLKGYELGLIPLAVASSLFIGTRGRRNQLKRKARAVLDDVIRQIGLVKAGWDAEKGPEQFDELRNKLGLMVEKHRQLPQKRAAQLKELEHRREEMQRRQWLDQHEIKDAKIKGIGDGRKSTLQSWGIETALDIDYHAVSQVPGFGPKMVDILLGWRQSIVLKFRFNPNLHADPAEVRRIEQGIHAERIQLEREITVGLANLRHLPVIASERYASLATQLSNLTVAEAKAYANLVAFR